MTTKTDAGARYDMVSAIIAYEDGELEEHEVQELFEHLVHTGLIYKLQGCYGREAHRRGLI